MFKTQNFLTLPIDFMKCFPNMMLPVFFRNGGLVRIFSKFYISVFSLVAIVLAFACDFSLYTLLVFASILVHELSHVIAINICGARIIRTVVYPFGIDLVCNMSSLSTMKELVCVVSGSCGNFVVSGIMYFCFTKYDERWMLFFCICCVVVGVANLIPLSTFDGGKALSLMLCTFLLPDFVYAISKFVDVICMGFLFISGLYFLDLAGFNMSLLVSFLYSALSCFLFGLYKLIR